MLQCALHCSVCSCLSLSLDTRHQAHSVSIFAFVARNALLIGCLFYIYLAPRKCHEGYQAFWKRQTWHSYEMMLLKVLVLLVLLVLITVLLEQCARCCCGCHDIGILVGAVLLPSKAFSSCH
ncbi:hypothetical protein BJ741DRAFT_626078 [Chytriomyces cf. hyalinus JEL632]|nr:hypothetical protein BJ741DRAFT_626078 [Chytriomyces cf. hyalinus JEL632]